MKNLILLILSLSLVACNPGKDEGEGQENSKDPKMPSLTPGASPTMIKDIWEYYQSNGSCTPSEKFGDGNQGCLMYVQITRFNDGSAFLSVNVGAGYFWTLNEFLPPGTSTFTKDLVYYSGSSVFVYQFKGNLSLSVPSFSANYDSNQNMSDSIAALMTLTKVVSQ